MTLHTQIGVALDGEALTYGESEDFTCSFFKSGAAVSSTDVKDAGDYVMRVIGQDEYAGSIVDLPFTVEKLDLSTAVIELDESTSAKVGETMPTKVTSVGGLDSSAMGNVKLTFVSASNGKLAPMPPPRAPTPTRSSLLATPTS